MVPGARKRPPGAEIDDKPPGLEKSYPRRSGNNKKNILLRAIPTILLLPSPFLLPPLLVAEGARACFEHVWGTSGAYEILRIASGALAEPEHCPDAEAPPRAAGRVAQLPAELEERERSTWGLAAAVCRVGVWPGGLF